MEIFATVRDFFRIPTGQDLTHGDDTEAEGDEGPLIAHRRADGTIMSESLLKTAASAAGRAPPPDLR